MTKKQLIEALANYDDDATVFIDFNGQALATDAITEGVLCDPGSEVYIEASDTDE